MTHASASTHGRRVAVVGAGIIGLSTAVRLRETLGDADDVTVLAKAFSPHTTSDGAAGLWIPVYYGDTPKDKLWSWGKRTWDFLSSFMADPKHPEMGVYYTSIYSLSSEPSIEPPFWADIVASFSILGGDEVRRLQSGANSGYHFTSMMTEGSKMVNYLSRRFTEGGGRCVAREIRSFDELVDDGYDLIVNCSGLGAKRLCADPDMYPIRGQIRMVRAPWIRSALFLGPNYVIPKQSEVVMGGTTQVGDWTLEVRDTDSQAIVSGCSRLESSLRLAPVVREWAGLRPGRKEVRLEKEERWTRAGDRRFTLVHNYGHGGAGLTMFWGCAEDACNLAVAALQRLPAHRL